MEHEHDIVIEFRSFMEFNADAGTLNDIETLSVLQHLTKFETEWENPKYFNFPDINLNIVKVANLTKPQDYIIFPVASDYEFTVEEVTVWMSEVYSELINGGMTEEMIEKVAKVLALVDEDGSLVFLEIGTKSAE
jgi:hypothetical protein